MSPALSTEVSEGLVVVPSVSIAEMRRIDEIAVRRFHVRLIQMMENAGRALADLVGERVGPRRATVLAGTGLNGGGGLVAARHLANRGVAVTVVSDVAATRAPLTEHHLRALRASGIAVCAAPRPGADVVIDALVGYSLSGPLHGRVAELARWTRRQGAPVVSLDLPTGLDATTGSADAAVVFADLTATLALPKRGLIGRPETGEVRLVDIGIPRAALAAAGIAAPALVSHSGTITLVPFAGGFAAEARSDEE